MSRDGVDTGLLVHMAVQAGTRRSLTRGTSAQLLSLTGSVSTRSARRIDVSTSRAATSLIRHAVRTQGRVADRLSGELSQRGEMAGIGSESFVVLGTGSGRSSPTVGAAATLWLVFSVSTRRRVSTTSLPSVGYGAAFSSVMGGDYPGILASHGCRAA